MFQTTCGRCYLPELLEYIFVVVFGPGRYLCWYVVTTLHSTCWIICCTCTFSLQNHVWRVQHSTSNSTVPQIPYCGFSSHSKSRVVQCYFGWGKHYHRYGGNQPYHQPHERLGDPKTLAYVVCVTKMRTPIWSLTSILANSYMHQLNTGAWIRAGSPRRYWFGT